LHFLSVTKSEQVTCGPPGLFVPADILVNENNAITEKMLSTVLQVFGNFSQDLGNLGSTWDFGNLPSSLRYFRYVESFYI